MSVYLPAFTAADLQAPPTDRAGGVAIGWDYPDPWRLQVELFTSPNGALWSESASVPGLMTAVWGTSVWAESPAWRNITDDVAGCDWTRGADQRNGRPRTGVLTVQLRNRDGRYSPQNRDGALYIADDYRPGTLIRVSVVCEDDETFADGWIPQFTGIVESWVDESIGVGAVSTVSITAVETTAFLAKIDDLELAAAVGADDRIGERLTRLLDAANSPFGFIDRYTGPYEDPVYGLLGGVNDYLYHLQATTMSQNRLAECYLTGDSMKGTVFRSARSGAFLLEQPWYSAFDPETARTSPQLTDELNTAAQNLLVVFTPAQHTLDDRARLVYEADTLKIRNDDEGIINQATVDIVGGSSPLTLSDEESIGRDGLRPFARYDFIGVDRSSCKTTYIQTETRRCEQVTVHNLNQKSERAVGALVGLDYGHHVFVELDPALRFYDIGQTTPYWVESDVQGPVARCRIRGMRHRVIPMNDGRCKWTADFLFDPVNHATPYD